MCKSRLEFQYCCFIVCAFCTIFLYWTYASLSSDNVVLHIQTEMDIHILNEMQTKNENGLISNTDNVTILIGLSPNQCGSSYIHHLLSKSFDLLHCHYIESDPMEIRYWDTCMMRIIPYYNYFQHLNHLNNDDGYDACNINQYLSKFINIKNMENKLDTTHFEYILFEKTPTYIRYYHSCYLLSHYAKTYNIYFYISLRNPTHRTWYQYLMHSNFKDGHNNTVDINKVNEKIQHEMNSFSYSYPKYQKLLDYIKIDSKLNASNNDDIDEEQVVDLWIDATYDLFNNLDYNSFHSKQQITDLIEGKHSAFNVPPFAISCYYPQVLMWYNTFKNNSIALEDRLRIFQFKWINERNGPQSIMKQLLSWIKTKDNENLYNNLRFNNGWKLHRHHEFDNVGVTNKLNDFYSDCNLRLYSFLNQHSELLLLPHRVFQF